MRRQIIRANRLEIARKRQQSLEKFRRLPQELNNQSGAMKNSVAFAAVRRSRG